MYKLNRPSLLKTAIKILNSSPETINMFYKLGVIFKNLKISNILFDHNST